MDMRKPMTVAEKKLFRQAIIREYKAKHERIQKKNTLYEQMLNRLRTIIPFNIFVGIVACVIIGFNYGWGSVIYLLLSGVVWITITSTILSAFLKK